MVKDKKDLTIRILAFLTIILALGLLYFLIINPAITKNQTQKYNQAFNDGQIVLLNSMISQIQQKGFVNIPLNENQSLVLVPYVPQSQGASQSNQ